MAEKTQMTRLRIWFVNSVIVVMLGLSIYPIIADKEHWPFSQYSMYAQAEQDWSLSVIRLVGVTGESEAIPLQSFKYIQPFNQSRQRVAFERLLAASGTQSSESVKAALKDCLLRYEKLRLAGLHDGPPLRGIRLYKFYWSRLDPQARNVDQPDRKELIDEILLPEA
jgi:hypothetical protein